MPGGIIYFVHGQLIFVEKIEFKYRNRCDRREKFKTNEHFKRKKGEIRWSRLIAFDAQRGPTNHFDPPRFLGIPYFFLIFYFPQGKKKRIALFCDYAGKANLSLYPSSCGPTTGITITLMVMFVNAVLDIKEKIVIKV